MKVTVCELSNDSRSFEREWNALVAHVRSEASELVLLPEMPFYPWMAKTPQVNTALWEEAVAAHEQWMPRLKELSPALVLSSRPIIEHGKRFNQGFFWDPSNGYQACHVKYYLPDEEGFWEATWYERGENDFKVVETSKTKLGFLICTELWFTEHARAYARQGIELLVCPRATPMSTVDKWIAGGRVAAVMSGAYCLSSNYAGNGGELSFGGTGWIIEPEEGKVLGLTSPDRPFLTLEIDLDNAIAAKQTYPRYVRE